MAVRRRGYGVTFSHLVKCNLTSVLFLTALHPFAFIFIPFRVASLTPWSFLPPPPHI